MSLRSASPDSFAIVDVSSGELLGSTEAARAHSTVHEGAIYMHLGHSYEVRELDLPRQRALVAPFDGDWYTQPKRETDTAIVRLLDRREALGVTLSFGEVSVTETVLAYQRRRLADHAQVDLLALDLPPTSFSTQALWFELDAADARREQSRWSSLLGALHATEHAQIAVLPLIAMCDRWDIGGLSTNFHAQTGAPTIFIYDGHPGGIGIARDRVRPLRGAVRGRPPADRRVPLLERLPLLRAVAEVRQPQRAAVQGRRLRAAGADARRGAGEPRVAAPL